ncbi:hypothetical protein FA13DRAFT_1704504 [Coprinellus micaceus]|uniref:Uncharacterized protein n=1 Tax=Coprinellus micaceus TaxID=71717 RepID=A0A4Y7TXU1_COPMI|nr:hypothetical protein FA13DRAFT_1704504 [Coprinellus micaceus]
MTLFSLDPSNLLGILITIVLNQTGTPMARRREIWWSALPCALIYALFVLLLMVQVEKTVHSSGTSMPSEALKSTLAKHEELVDTLGVAICIAVFAWLVLDHFWRPSAQQQHIRAEDIELQIVGWRDDAPQPHRQPVELRARGEGVRRERGWDTEARGDLRNVDSLDELVVPMPGALPG